MRLLHPALPNRTVLLPGMRADIPLKTSAFGVPQAMTDKAVQGSL